MKGLWWWVGFVGLVWGGVEGRKVVAEMVEVVVEGGPRWGFPIDDCLHR